MKKTIIANLFFGALCCISTQSFAQGYIRPHSEVTPKPAANIEIQSGIFESTEESLAAWECPEWYRDVKFGIWAHWGPQCQAEWGDWYARGMYITGDGQYNHHVATYGSPATYGLKELCRDFTAPDWDPDALVKLYSDAGAQYFMALGNHHDNFDLWDSPYQEWNSVNVGIGKDVLKGWFDACKKYGLKRGVSMHAAHTWMWLEPSQDFDGNLTKEEGAGKWWEGYDPQELYAQRHARETVGGWHWDWDGSSKPDMPYMMKFQNRVLQCINDYSPDIIYFDDSVLPFWYYNNQIGLNILKHFYNHSAAQNGGQQQVVATGKILNDSHKKFLMWDVERGIPDRAQPLPWQTCTCIGSWHYDVNVYNQNRYKSAATVIRMLVDVVSKNGNLLLSVPVNRRGTIDSREKAVVAGIKAWMDINKESIYGTRPWKVCGEGPLYESSNPLNAQGFNENINYSNRDVRYNAKDDKVYATIMVWPSAGEFTFKAFSVVEPSYSGRVSNVKLLGYGNVAFSFDSNGLTVTIPSTHPNDIAPVFEITFDNSNTAYNELQDLIQVVESIADNPLMEGINTGKYLPETIEKIKSLVQDAKAIDESADEQAIQGEINTLRKQYSIFIENGKVPGGNLGTQGKNLTTDILLEETNFSRSDGKTTRFGTPTNWTVENFSIPQTNSNGTKNGIDNYPGSNCLMLGVWAGEDGSTSSNLKNARIYRKVTLPAGKYFFGATYNAAYQLSSSAYIFASETLSETSEIPYKSIAYYPLNKSVSQDGIYYGIEFTLDEEKELYLGWQIDLTIGSSTQEIRVQSVRLVSRNEQMEILQDASQPMGGLFADITVGELIQATQPFQAKNMGSRYGTPVNWTVENYSIPSGSGTRGGIDNYPGYNCLSLGIWGDVNSNKGDSKNARIYRKVTLEPGTYYFGAQYETRYNLNDAFLFASGELLNTSDIPTGAMACHPLSDIANAGKNSTTWYGIVFRVDEERDIYLGWQADLTKGGANQEFRAKSVTLLRYDNIEDLSSEKLSNCSNFTTTEMGSRYGTPTDWTVENYSIPNSAGRRNGVDNYPGYNCLSIGIWGDRANNEGDGKNARIYQKVMLDAGKYYFGASYQVVYNFPANAFFFAATSLVNTASLPTSPTTLAYKRLNTIPLFTDNTHDEKYYVTFDLEEPAEVYLGWQANITTGDVNQEFRAKNVQLLKFTDKEEGGSTAIENISFAKYLSDNVFYNLNGQRVKTPSRGIYILNGKKILLK